MGKQIHLSPVTCCVSPGHIVPFGKFHRIGGAPPETFPSENYDTPEEVGGDRKCLTALLGNEV